MSLKAQVLVASNLAEYHRPQIFLLGAVQEFVLGGEGDGTDADPFQDTGAS